mmetsp:Transcript_83707/g.255786  ORF Transcript_83707/g.255786 Transcript_83707/m.255786 type:complete len:206 (-) Transcript_83707:101-718(-)
MRAKPSCWTASNMKPRSPNNTGSAWSKASKLAFRASSTISRSACMLRAAQRKANAFCLTASLTNSLSRLSASSAYVKASPQHCVIACMTKSLSRLSASSAYCNSASRPQPSMARRTKSLSARSAASANRKAVPRSELLTASSTISGSALLSLALAHCNCPFLAASSQYVLSASLVSNALPSPLPVLAAPLTAPTRMRLPLPLPLL